MADSERQVEGVIVRIMDEEYRIGGDPTQVQQVADHVDRKMREIADGHRSRLPKAQVAILAAMEITAELFKAMQERKLFTDKAHQSIGRLTKLVEDRATLSAEGEEGTQTVMPLDRLRSDRADRATVDRPVDHTARLQDPATVS